MIFVLEVLNINLFVLIKTNIKMIKVLIVTELKEKNAEFVSGREFSNGETLVVITLYEDCL